MNQGQTNFKPEPSPLSYFKTYFFKHDYEQKLSIYDLDVL